MMNPATKDVTAVTVTYESETIIADLAKTLRRFMHVIAVDNASQDGTTLAISRHLPHATILKNAKNVGFGAGNNLGVALVQTRYALLLNPDCEISEDALSKLLAAAETYPNAAIIAPQGVYGNGKLQPSYRHAFFEKREKQDYLTPDASCSAKWLHGCCLLVRVDAFRKFGGFDERFFLYFEDDDLCLTALQAGYDCLLEPGAQVLHRGGASSKPSVRVELLKNFHWARSRHLILNKYQGRQSSIKYRLKIAITAPLAILVYTLLLKKKYLLKWLGWGYFAWKLR